MSLKPKEELKNTFTATAKAVKEELDFYKEHKDIINKYYDLETAKVNAMEMLSFLCNDIKGDDESFEATLKTDELELIMYKDSPRFTIIDNTILEYDEKDI